MKSAYLSLGSITLASLNMAFHSRISSVDAIPSKACSTAATACTGALDRGVVLGDADRQASRHLLELARDRLGRGLDRPLPVVEVITQAEMVTAETAITDPAALIFGRRDVGSVDVTVLINPDRVDAGGAENNSPPDDLRFAT